MLHNIFTKGLSLIFPTFLVFLLSFTSIVFAGGSAMQVYERGELPDVTVAPGSHDIEVGRFEFHVTDDIYDGSDMSIREIRFDVEGIFRNSDVDVVWLKETSTGIFIDNAAMVDGEVYFNAFDYYIPNGESRELSVYADISEYADANNNFQFQITDPNDIEYVVGNTGEKMGDIWGVPVYGPRITISSSTVGTGTIDIDRHSTSPWAQDVDATLNDHTFAVAEIDVTEDVEINEMRVHVDAFFTEAYGVPMTEDMCEDDTAMEAYLHTKINNVSVWVGSNLVSGTPDDFDYIQPGQFNGTGCHVYDAYYTFDEEFLLTTGSNTVTLTADLHDASHGDVYSLSIDNGPEGWLDAEYATVGDDVPSTHISGYVQGQNQTVVVEEEESAPVDPGEETSTESFALEDIFEPNMREMIDGLYTREIDSMWTRYAYGFYDRGLEEWSRLYMDPTGKSDSKKEHTVYAYRYLDEDSAIAALDGFENNKGTSHMKYRATINGVGEQAYCYAGLSLNTEGTYVGQCGMRYDNFVLLINFNYTDLHVFDNDKFMRLKFTHIMKRQLQVFEGVLYDLLPGEQFLGSPWISSMDVKEDEVEESSPPVPEVDDTTTLDLKKVLLKTNDRFHGFRAGSIMDEDLTIGQYNSYLSRGMEQLFVQILNPYDRDDTDLSQSFVAQKFTSELTARAFFDDYKKLSNKDYFVRYAYLGDEGHCYTLVPQDDNYYDGACELRYKNIILRVHFSYKDIAYYYDASYMLEKFNLIAVDQLKFLELRLYDLIDKKITHRGVVSIHYEVAEDPTVVVEDADSSYDPYSPVEDEPYTPPTVERPSSGFEEDVVVNERSYDPPVVIDNPFSDTDISTPEGGAAAVLYDLGIIGGFPDGEFKGDRPVNRAEAAKFLLLSKYEEIYEVENNGYFWDVKNGEWYTKYVMTAAGLRIINGYSDGSFRPADTVNTVEFLKMLTLTFGLETHLAHPYKDVDHSAWYAQYLGVAHKYDLFPHRRSDRILPASELTRDEVAVAIYQYLLNR